MNDLEVKNHMEAIRIIGREQRKHRERFEKTVKESNKTGLGGR